MVTCSPIIIISCFLSVCVCWSLMQSVTHIISFNSSGCPPFCSSVLEPLLALLYEDTLQTPPLPAFLFFYCSPPLVDHTFPGQAVGFDVGTVCPGSVSTVGRTWLWSQAACVPAPALALVCDSRWVPPPPRDFTVLICHLGMMSACLRGSS